MSEKLVRIRQSDLAMMRPAKAVMRNDATGNHRANSARRASLSESKMRAVFVVEANVFREQMIEMRANLAFARRCNARLGMGRLSKCQDCKRDHGGGNAEKSNGWRSSPTFIGTEYRGVYGFHAASVCCDTPSPSIPNSTTSPAFRYFGGRIPRPTPAGVPVLITSPGTSVMKSLR